MFYIKIHFPCLKLLNIIDNFRAIYYFVNIPQIPRTLVFPP